MCMYVCDSPFWTRSCAAVTFFFLVWPEAASFFCCCCFMLHIFNMAAVVSAGHWCLSGLNVTRWHASRNGWHCGRGLQ